MSKRIDSNEDYACLKVVLAETQTPNKDQENPTPYRVSELLSLPVIAAFYRSDRHVRDLGLDRESFPPVVCTEDLLNDVHYQRSKRLEWEASVRWGAKNETQVRFGLRINVRDSLRDDPTSPSAKLASKVLASYDRDPTAFYDWMN